MTTEPVLLGTAGAPLSRRRTGGDLHGTRRRRTRLRHRLRPRCTVRIHRSGTGLLPSGAAGPGTTDLTEHILAGYAYHLNVIPLDAHMPDARALVRATDIAVPDKDGPAK